MVNTILKEADLFCPNSVRINFTIYHSGSYCRVIGCYFFSIRKRPYCYSFIAIWSFILVSEWCFA
ncbi:hypothetical protein GBO99_08355 [Pediococcus acidilactici]|nr:hypothetical protein GBO38_08820 [Pediococcus acidilactici]KAF0347997.1 hypothetical protein GBO44_00420 [Pediococcus acidilactici]KAF0398147.1 hypothetical protein GBO72_02675 [Pediococcus acidilactici]KAF0458383.1 hypothetical protein GBO99_08355 [Pediococcus acidilactici]KAF0520469.1 hypothetical protein GBP30_08010 [Pediococcus acidilactici]